jgi:2-methylcitrate dehydratase PrpD
VGQSIEQLAEFVAATRCEDIPNAVRNHARLVLLDSFGVILAGSERPEVAALRRSWAAPTGAAATVYARGWPSQDARTAALLNGIAGRAIELCEGQRFYSGQAAIQVLPGVLALAQARRTTGRDLLTAFVLGYEAAARLCSVFTPRALAHQNGQACMLGAAAAGARVSGFDAAATSLAMRVATILLLTPSYTNAVAGATSLNVAGAMSSFVGVLAPDLVRCGFEAQPDAVEEALGQMVGAGFDAAHLVDELGTRWDILRNYFRLYACCNPIHPALDALAAVLRALNGPSAEDIERIEVATYRFASVMRNPDPPSFFASKYSLPHAAAVMVVRGDLSHAALDDSALRDPRIARLRSRVSVAEDPAMTAAAPRLRPARVTVTLKDGRQASHACDSHRGDFMQPFERSELDAKFRDLAGCVLSAEGVERAAAMIENLEAVADVHAALAALGAHARPVT